MKTCFEIGISMTTVRDENNNEINMYSVALDVTGEYGCTSPWKEDFFNACYWCINSMYQMAGEKAYFEALEQFSNMFPNDAMKFELPF